MVGHLFIYGTLRDPAVQLAVFGRHMAAVADALPGFRLDVVKIVDPAVIATSGSDEHPILRRSPAGESVAGLALAVTRDDLVAADAYEVPDYRRIDVRLASGRCAFVYVAADEA